MRMGEVNIGEGNMGMGNMGMGGNIGIVGVDVARMGEGNMRMGVENVWISMVSTGIGIGMGNSGGYDKDQKWEHGSEGREYGGGVSAGVWSVSSVTVPCLWQTATELA